MSQSGELEYNIIDSHVSMVFVQALEPWPDAAEQVQRLIDRGWRYSAMLGIYIDALSNDYLHDVAYVAIPLTAGNLPNMRLTEAHDILAGHLFGQCHIDLLRIDPRGVLFGQVGRALYWRQRLNGNSTLWVHPWAHDYIQALVNDDSPTSSVQIRSNNYDNTREHRQQKRSSRKKKGKLSGGNADAQQKQHQQISAECIIGKGKYGSFVFQAEANCFQQFVHIPAQGVVEFCLEYYNGAKECVETTVRQLIDELSVKESAGKSSDDDDVGNGLVMKVNASHADTSAELKANRLIGNWMAQLDLLQLTPLTKHVLCIHPRSSRIRQKNYMNYVYRDVLVMRKLDGDIRSLENEPLSINDFVQIASTALTVLDVCHENRHLHQDIKPLNILYYTKPDGSRRFALADYGIMDSIQNIYNSMENENRYSGTYGYMSPMLFRGCADSQHNKVLHKFERVGRGATQPGITQEDVRKQMVNFKTTMVHKFPANIHLFGKMDLQCLGMTLLDTYSKHLLKMESDNNRPNNDFMVFLEKLMFTRPGIDFVIAKEALQFLSTSFPA